MMMSMVFLMVKMVTLSRSYWSFAALGELDSLFHGDDHVDFGDDIDDGYDITYWITFPSG